MSAKPKPAYIYREEQKNDKGEWVCVRMTYDPDLHKAWRGHYQKWWPQPWMNERRFLIGTVSWEADPL